MPQIPIPQRFFRGIDSDTSYTERDGNSYLDAQNIRITRRDGSTLWLCTMGSTEEAFALPIGYVPVGKVYHRGVLFLMIHNETSGYTQIGCYPSPDPLNSYQYERVYRPLLFTKQPPWEYIGDGCEVVVAPTLQPLDTIGLDISLDDAVWMEARGESDGSTTLYWTDGVNPIRLANSCFDIVSGLPTGRYLSEKELLSDQWDLVNENSYHPKYQLLGVTSGGILKVGHIIFAVRYTDTQYGYTSLLSWSAPVPITNNGSGSVPVGGESVDSSDKQVELLITGLDPDAAMVEIAYIRYLSQDEYEAVLIDQRYTLDGSGTLTVTITGRESTVPLSIDEAVSLKPYDARTAVCIEQLGNTLYTANTRGRQLDHPDLRALGCLINMDEHVEPLGTIEPIYTPDTDQMYGKDEKDVFKRVGYFSAETYSFAMLPILKGGFFGLPIPLKGTDHISGASIGTNDRGIFRFSDAAVVNYHDGTNAIGKAIKFLTSNPAVTAHIAGSQWIQDNVIGFYFCRAERKANMLYQGLHLYGYNGKVARRFQYEFPLPANKDEMYSSYISPLFDMATYGAIFGKDHGGFFGGGSDVNGYTYYAGNVYNTQDAVGLNKACIVSSDYMLAKVEVPSTAYVRRLQRTNYLAWERVHDSVGNTNMLTKSQLGSGAHVGLKDYLGVDIDIPPGNDRRFVGYDQNGASIWDTDGYTSDMVDVKAWDAVPVGEGRFVSRREEGAFAQQDGWYYINPNYATFEERNKDFSLPIACPSYIGVDAAPSTMFPWSNVNAWNHAIVGVYRSDPATLSIDEWYNPISEFYYPIGDYITLSDFTTSDHIRWQGDCFIGRSYIRLISGHTEQIGSELLDLISQKEAVFDPNYPRIILEEGWGYWIGYVAEHAYNPQYRIELGRNLYYPASGVGNEGKGFAWLLDSPESDFYNTSYKRMLSPRGLLPSDPLQPVSAGRFETRVRASFTHVIGAIRDGYRQFAEIDKIDLDYSQGAITSLHAVGEMLYSIQESAINLHPINERSTSSTDKGTTFVTGGLQKLPPYRTYISNQIGCQHRFGTCIGQAGLYGYDARRRIWWRVAMNNLDDLSMTRKAQSFLYVHLDAPLRSDRVSDRPDKMLRRQGIQMTEYGEYYEVWLTIYDESGDYTIAFSEILDAFMCRVTVQPTLYCPMGKELISFNGNEKGMLHDQSNDDLVFYGVQRQATVRFVYGYAGEAVKHWDALMFNQNNTKWKEIRYETQHQSAIQVFDNPAEFWYKPYYRENQWKQSIRRADVTIEPDLSLYDVGSPLRGQYLIVELIYEDTKKLWLREVIAQATPSKA